MTNRILEIKYCASCPHRDRDVISPMRAYFCTHDNVPENNTISPGFSAIPDWCPLPKAKEND